MTTLTKIHDLSRQRRDLIGAIAILTHRHRKRKGMQRTLCRLTTAQLNAELKFERQHRKAA